MRVVVPGPGRGSGGSYWGVSGAKEGWQVDPSAGPAASMLVKDQAW